jgi:two-component system response regulator LytT
MSRYESTKATFECVLPEADELENLSKRRLAGFDHIYQNFLKNRIMKIFLIEDEPMAMLRLKQLLMEIDKTVEIVGDADSVEQALSWLDSNTLPDAIFTDVQLADGTCFDLFSKFTPKCPVVFITAYNHFAVEAFKVNAQDYILKPLKKEELEKALQKVSRHITPILSNLDYSKLAQAIIQEEQKFDRRYLIRYGEQVRTVHSDEIAYIYTTHKAIFLVLTSGKEYPLDKTMDNLEKELDPKKFFRINRQFIVSLKSIGNMHVVSKSRIQIELHPPHKEDDVIVSTEKSPIFKEWLGGEKSA